MSEVDNQSERHNYINERVVETPRKRLKRLIKKVILTGFFAVIFGVVACVVFVYLRPILESTISNPGETTTTVPDNEEPTTEEPTTSEKIYTAEDLKNLYGQVSKLTEEMKKSVVTINAYTGEKGIFQTPEYEIISSGVIVSKNAYVHILALYNNVKDMDNIKIILPDGTSLPAEIVAYDEVTGLVLLSVNMIGVDSEITKNLAAADFSNVSTFSSNEPVIYIGNPFGMNVYETIGFLNSQSSVITGMDNSYELLRTDIFISNCQDGFVFDIDGELLGIVTGSEKVVEAIAAVDVKHIVEGMSSGKGVVYLGVTGEAVTDEIRQISGIDMPNGVYVTDVAKDSPAYVSGIRKGDIITKIGNSPVKSMANIKTCLKNNKAGNKLNIIVSRQNGDKFETYSLSVILTNRKVKI